MSEPILEGIRRAMKQLEDVPPKPMLASWDLLPRENAVSFSHEGKKYVGAHPDFWKQIPASERGKAQSAFALEIIDFSLPFYAPQKEEFVSALAQAFGGPSS